MDMSDDIIEIFLKNGYIEIVGQNSVGDNLYRFTELFYQEQSELVEQMRIQDSDLMNSLWFKGYIDLMMDDVGNAYVYLNNKSDTWVNSEDLTEEEKSMMYLIYSTEKYMRYDD
jgi:hypothetical protein